MNRWSKHVVVGVVTSVFVTPIVGGAVAGYLNGPDGREMLRSGVVVGALTGLLAATFYLLVTALVEGPRSVSSQLVPYTGFAGAIVVLTVVLTLLGSGFGNALAYRYRSRRTDRAST